MTVYTSIDFLDTKPIETGTLINMSNSPDIDPSFAEYIKGVLTKAKAVAESVGETFDSIKFEIHQTGCIVPFGESAYTHNFLTA